VKTWNLPKIKIIKIFRLFNKKKTLGCNLSLLRDTIEQIERVTAWSINDAYVDLGYRGHDYKGETQIKIVNYRTMKKLTRTVRKWFGTAQRETNPVSEAGGDRTDYWSLEIG